MFWPFLIGPKLLKNNLKNFRDVVTRDRRSGEDLQVTFLTCTWCPSSATRVSCGRSCSWPRPARRSGASSWCPPSWRRSLRSLAERRTSASSSACPSAPWGCTGPLGTRRTYSGSAAGRTRRTIRVLQWVVKGLGGSTKNRRLLENHFKASLRHLYGFFEEIVP